MEKKRFIAIRNQADSQTLELYFLDVIADTYDWYTGYNSKVQEIIDKVNFYKPSKIKCIIDSEGGDAQIGMSIYNFLKRCDAKVEVEIIGLAGSIASVIAMAANKGKLRIAKNAFMVIHRAEGGCYGNSEDLRNGANLIDLYTSQIVDIYSQRTGKSVDDINALIASGDYWMTGEDAVAQGFADETFNGLENVQIAARLDQNFYKNIPAQIRAQLKPETGKPDVTESFITNQFEQMKKFFTDIVNAIKGVKPSTDPAVAITNQIADAVTAPFEKLADEIETTISNKVTEVVASETVNNAIGVRVTNAVTAAVDFSKDGVGKTAIENAVKDAVDFTKEGPAKTAFDTAVKNAVTELTKDYTKKIGDLETEIVNMKGGKSKDENKDDPPVPIGKWQ